MKGRIFDIEEFAVYDGPGIRTVVFFKGCPLRCQWCHNPEGLDFRPTRVTQVRLCEHCGLCQSVCPNRSDPSACTGCGECAKICPKGLIRIAGNEIEAETVAKQVLKNEALLKMNDGGVTFSGGEPLAQIDFLMELRNRLSSLHACIETSGFAPEDVFQKAAESMDLVILDVKLVDPGMHKRYTGVSNEPILANLSWLKNSGIPFRIRIPLIPGVNDSAENLTATSRLLEGAKNLEKVELLPYHTTAGAKYASVSKTFSPEFDTQMLPNADTTPFTNRNMEVNIL